MRFTSAAIVAAALLAPASGAIASTITVVPDVAANKIGETAIPDATAGIAGAGYLLFGFNGVSQTTSGVASSGYADTYITNNRTYESNGDSLSVNGVSHATGQEYSGVAQELVTFTLGSDVPSDFVLSVLTDNVAGGTNNMASVSVVATSSSVGNPTSGSSQAVAGSPTTASNDFYSFMVTNASPGDTVEIYATAASGTSESIGGVAFNAVAMPEPGSLLLAGVGGAGLMFRRRRRAAK